MTADSIVQDITELETLLSNVVPDVLTRVTQDAARVKPGTGEVHAYIAAPRIEWESWTMFTAEYSVYLVAGTTTSAADALGLLYQVIDDITATATVNVVEAEPVNWTRDTSNVLAAYLLTINKQ